MSDFTSINPSLETYWRAILLFGKNSASYKFALAKALLEVADKEKTFVLLGELAEPYTRHLIEHLRSVDRQGTSRSSRFLNYCRGFLREEITRDQLIEHTTRLGFVNVIDAFHVVSQGEIPKRFFVDERKRRGGIVITDELLYLKESTQFSNLPFEAEARWRLVETAWSLQIPTGISS